MQLCGSIKQGIDPEAQILHFHLLRVLELFESFVEFRGQPFVREVAEWAKDEASGSAAS
jgi:hypothetical protein